MCLNGYSKKSGRKSIFSLSIKDGKDTLFARRPLAKATVFMSARLCYPNYMCHALKAEEIQI